MVIKKNKRRLVTPASGSPDVEQGLTKRSLNMLVQNAVKQPQSVKQQWYKQSKENQLIANKSRFISQEQRTITPDSPVQGAGTTY